MATLRLLSERGKERNVSLVLARDGSARFTHSYKGQVTIVADASAEDVRAFIEALTRESQG